MLLFNYLVFPQLFFFTKPLKHLACSSPSNVRYSFLAQFIFLLHARFHGIRRAHRLFLVFNNNNKHKQEFPRRHLKMSIQECLTLGAIDKFAFQSIEIPKRRQRRGHRRTIEIFEALTGRRIIIRSLKSPYNGLTILSCRILFLDYTFAYICIVTP